MLDIFISYSRQDMNLVKNVADKLSLFGWHVWWDKYIPVGKDYDVVIEENILSCKCMLVIWTENSIHSRNVKDEANEALTKGKLLPILIGNTKAPIGFRMIQAVIWNDHQSVEDREFSDLLSHLEVYLGKPLIPKELNKPDKVSKQQVSSEARNRSKTKTCSKKIEASNSAHVDQLKLIFTKYNSYKRLYIYPDIPSNKLKTALGNFWLEDDEKVICLIDLTILGSADDFFIFTNKTMYYRHFLNTDFTFFKLSYLDFAMSEVKSHKDTTFYQEISVNNLVLYVGGANIPVPDYINLLNEIKLLY